jgi:hypothetical protein
MSESWIIREKATGKVMFETFNKKVADAINKTRYEAVCALKHLQELNRRDTKTSQWMRRHEK